jgi:hypothetical protein
VNKLFLQGGLGNQLIQAAASRCLCSDTGSSTVLNLFKLGPVYYSFNSVTPRQPSNLLLRSRFFRSCSILPSFIDYILLFCLLRFRPSQVVNDHSFTNHLGIASRPLKDPLFISGFFHFSQAFTHPRSLPFWKEISSNLLQFFPPPVSPFVSVHMRTTDYFASPNQSLFCSLDYTSIVSRALHTASSFSPPLPVCVVTDSIEMASKILSESQLRAVTLISSSPESDLALLSSSQYLYMANSSFSLCAARLASLLNPSHISFSPTTWYLKPDLNLTQITMLKALPFVSFSSL